MTFEEMPIIKLQFTQMQRTIQMALVEHNEDLSKAIQQLIDNFFKPENIEEIFKHEITRMATEILHKEIKNALTYEIYKTVNEPGFKKKLRKSLFKNLPKEAE